MRRPAATQSSQTLGLVDVGTTSTHLLIGRLSGRGRFRPTFQRHNLTRLGAGGLIEGRLQAAAIRRTWDVLTQYAQRLRRDRVDWVEAVATSAVRDAANGRTFVERVRRLGIPLRIISGREEARLIYLGVASRRPATLVIAIGGGSAQVAVGTRGRCRYAVSRPLGGARLAQRFFRRDPSEPAAVAALEAYTRKTWRSVALALRRYRWTEAVGGSAAIAQVVAAARAVQAGRSTTITRPALRRLAAWLAERTADDRRGLSGVDPRRQDLLLPTAIALLTWMEACGVTRLRYAPGSLREGLVVEASRRLSSRGAGNKS